MSNDVVLELKNIKHGFVQGRHKLDILCGLNLKIKRGEIVALLGPSGSGKSTLLQIAGLLEAPLSGEVVIENINISKKQNDSVRTGLRRDNIGFVYQSHHLLPDFTALENLLLPQYIAGKSKKESKKKGMELLKSVGIENRADHFPSQMSGGEQQRVAIARGLVNNPSLLLADEPTGNLDPKTSDEVFKVMVDTIRKYNAGALIVTHNTELAARMDRILVLKDGMV